MDFTTYLFFAALFSPIIILIIYYIIALPWRLIRGFRVRGWNKARAQFQIEFETSPDGITRCRYFGDGENLLSVYPGVVSTDVAFAEFFYAVRQMVRA